VARIAPIAASSRSRRGRTAAKAAQVASCQISAATSVRVRMLLDLSRLPAWPIVECMRVGLSASSLSEVIVRARQLLVLLMLGIAASAAGWGGGGVMAKSVSPCRSDVQDVVLPRWAWDGFSYPRPRLPHVIGAAGSVIAIIWGFPLLSPPSRHYNNKILWVSRVTTDPGSNLRIAAQRMLGSRSLGAPVARVATGGPGPSIVNLPASGCWRLTVRWSGRLDRLDLEYHASA
jgi:hypothetical protein